MYFVFGHVSVYSKLCECQGCFATLMLCGGCACIECDSSAQCVLEYSMRKGAGFLVAEEWLERSWELAARQERSSTKLAAQKATPKCSGAPGSDKKNFNSFLLYHSVLHTNLEMQALVCELI